MNRKLKYKNKYKNAYQNYFKYGCKIFSLLMWGKNMSPLFILKMMSYYNYNTTVQFQRNIKDSRDFFPCSFRKKNVFSYR